MMSIYCIINYSVSTISDRIQSFHTQALRRILGIRWYDKVPNAVVNLLLLVCVSFSASVARVWRYRNLFITIIITIITIIGQP